MSQTSEAQLLLGKEIAARLRDSLKIQLEKRILEEPGRLPKLGTLRIGDAEDARLYEEAIVRLCSRMGVGIEAVKLPGTASEAGIQKAMADLPRAGATGTLILSPVPPAHRYDKILSWLSPANDVEGTRGSFGGAENETPYPPTALAVLEAAKASGVTFSGKHAVVIGRSRIVGRPAAELLLQQDATVTVCHSKTPNLEHWVRQADFLVAACGRAELIRGEWIKPGAVVIDAGENVTPSGLKGDVAFAEAARRAAWITPVPGGVGPITPYMLIRNLLVLHRQQKPAADSAAPVARHPGRA